MKPSGKSPHQGQTQQFRQNGPGGEDEKLSEASNKLEGVQVIHREWFEKLGGYDDLLQGWGAGGDMDMIDRLAMNDVDVVTMPESIVEKSIQHSMDERTKFHQNKSTSYTHLVGILYRKSKLALMRLFNKELSLEDRQKLHGLATNAASRPTGERSTHVELLVTSESIPGANYKTEQKVITKVTWEK